jgi:hypothetical protein
MARVMMRSKTQAEAESTRAQDNAVEAMINYLGPMDERPKFHAQDHRRDNLRYDQHSVKVHNARAMPRVSIEARAFAVFG